MGARSRSLGRGILRCSEGLLAVLLAAGVCRAKPDGAEYTYVPGPLYILQITGDQSTYSRVAYWDDYYGVWHYEYPDEEGYHHWNGQPWAVELMGGLYWKVEQDTGQGWQRVAAYNRCVVDLDSLTVDSELPGTQYDHNIPLNAWAQGEEPAYAAQRAKVRFEVAPDEPDVQVCFTIISGFTGQIIKWADYATASHTVSAGDDPSDLLGLAPGAYTILATVGGHKLPRSATAWSSGLRSCSLQIP